MKYSGHIKRLCGAALLCVGSAAPLAGLAHVEGVEAADPATPTALLTLDSATRGYTALNGASRQWRGLFEGQGSSSATEPAHSGHTGTAQHTSATMQQ